MPGRNLIGHRDFRLLWGGETVSELGAQVSLLAIPLLAVRTLQATTFEVGALTATSTAAFLLIGLPTGVWADRIRRRRIMIAADLGRLLALGSVPVAFALGRLTLAQLFVVVLASGMLTVLFDVAYQSYLPSLVGRERLVEGNAKLTGSAQVAQVAGPSLAGGLVQALGGAYAIGVDALSFLISGPPWRPSGPLSRRSSSLRAGTAQCFRTSAKVCDSSSATCCFGPSWPPPRPPISSVACRRP